MTIVDLHWFLLTLIKKVLQWFALSLLCLEVSNAGASIVVTCAPVPQSYYNQYNHHKDNEDNDHNDTSGRTAWRAVSGTYWAQQDKQVISLEL